MPSHDPASVIARGESLNQSSWPLLKRWTDEEHAQLKSMAAEGARVEEIAQALNRSEKAVRARAWQHNIDLRLIAPKSRPRRMPG
jgi:DNA-binding NarL/FixJ family response regulator